MNRRPIIDAGPGLNFLSVNKERLLIGTLGSLSAPEIVQTEVLRKSRTDERFRAAATTWQKLVPKWIEILPDDETPELAAVVHRITRQPISERLRQPKDLGEIMVIAHAVVAAESGDAVTVLIDDEYGAKTASAEIHRLRRIQLTGRTVGAIMLINTLTVLRRAAGGEHLPDKTSMRNLYKRLRDLDDGLPPLETTNLLAASVWP